MKDIDNFYRILTILITVFIVISGVLYEIKRYINKKKFFISFSGNCLKYDVLVTEKEPLVYIILLEKFKHNNIDGFLAITINKNRVTDKLTDIFDFIVKIYRRIYNINRE